MNLRFAPGFVLTELLVTGLLTAFLMLGLIQMAVASSRGLNLIEAISQKQQGGRFAIEQMRSRVMAAGFDPSPWRDEIHPTLPYATGSDGGPGGNDQLVVFQLSDKNCYENPNPITMTNGLPAFYLRESIFEVNHNHQLVMSCRYGAEESSMVRQINRQGLVQRVESFQILFAEAPDNDQNPNHWVRADQWENSENVLGVKLGLMLASERSLSEPVLQSEKVLDEIINIPADGHLRTTWTTVFAIPSRLR